MNLCIGGPTALAAVRLCRVRGWMPRGRTVVCDPSPYPHQRWTRARVLEALAPLEGLAEAVCDQQILVCGSSVSHRPQMRGVTSAVTAPAWPQRPFVRVTDGLAFATPELLLTHIAAHGTLVEVALVAYELCGTYSYDPRNQKMRYGVASVCSVEGIQRVVRAMPGKVRGRAKLMRALAYVRDNSWSPMESLLALLLALPTSEGGYGMEDITLNQTVAGNNASVRIPDILLGDTHVGINYEGEEHFGTRELARAAHVAATVGTFESFEQVETASRSVRTRIVRDKRRDRDLIFADYKVVMVTKEDLQQVAQLDQLIWQVAKLAAKERRMPAPTKVAITGDAEARFKRRQLVREALQVRWR